MRRNSEVCCYPKVSQSDAIAITGEEGQGSQDRWGKGTVGEAYHAYADQLGNNNDRDYVFERSSATPVGSG